jgi:hypothetical protein
MEFYKTATTVSVQEKSSGVGDALQCTVCVLDFGGINQVPRVKVSQTLSQSPSACIFKANFSKMTNLYHMCCDLCTSDSLISSLQMNLLSYLHCRRMFCILKLKPK